MLEHNTHTHIMTQKMTIYNTARCFLSMHGGYHRNSRQSSPFDNTHSACAVKLSLSDADTNSHSPNHVDLPQVNLYKPRRVYYRCPQHGVSVTIRSFLLTSVRQKWQDSFSLAASSDVARIPNRLNLLDEREQSGAG